MTDPQTEHDAQTRALMAAAHSTAWTAICLAQTPSELRKPDMFSAIVEAVARGERDFMKLQQAAIDAFGAPIKAVERRQGIRLVSS
jgi:hypothetical protein